LETIEETNSYRKLSQNIDAFEAPNNEKDDLHPGQNDKNF